MQSLFYTCVQLHLSIGILYYYFVLNLHAHFLILHKTTCWQLQRMLQANNASQHHDLDILRNDVLTANNVKFHMTYTMIFTWLSQTQDNYSHLILSLWKWLFLHVSHILYIIVHVKYMYIVYMYMYVNFL